MKQFPVAAFIAFLSALPAAAQDAWVVYDGFDGPGEGKHIVLVSGDDEYRSEEALPQLGKILAKRHGFKCTVLFPVAPDGTIKPDFQKNIPGLEALGTADLMIMGLRFRDLPDDQMKQIDAYLKKGKPVLGMRTSTHAFRIRGNKAWEHYGNGYRGDKEAWRDGFGRLVLGEKWISHHGRHKKESTRGLIAGGAKDHPVVRGIKDGDIWGPTDVYGVRLPLPGDSKPIVMGQVLVGMNKDDEPLEGKKNDPMLPVGWSKSYQVPGGEKGRAFTTTMGSSTDLVAAGTRRMIVNAAYWLLGLEVPSEGTNVGIVGEFKPTPYGFGNYRKGVRPADHKLK